MLIIFHLSTCFDISVSKLDVFPSRVCRHLILLSAAKGSSSSQVLSAGRFARERGRRRRGGRRGGRRVGRKWESGSMKSEKVGER